MVGRAGAAATAGDTGVADRQATRRKGAGSDAATVPGLSNRAPTGYRYSHTKTVGTASHGAPTVCSEMPVFSLK